MELLEPKSNPELIISQHIMNIQQNKYTSLESRLILPKLFFNLLPELKMLLNTGTTLINMLESKDITITTTCLIIDILNAILPNAPYQLQCQFSLIYYKLIKNYKSNTLLYHLLSMDIMHYLELDDASTLSLYRQLRGFMHSDHKKIKLKAIQQYYIFCIQNHAVVTSSIKIFTVLDIFLDRNMVVSHMIREQSSIALSTLLYFYSKQSQQPESNAIQATDDMDEEITKKKPTPVKKEPTFTESDVFPALFRNMELAFLERDYVAYLLEVLGRYLQMKGKSYMEQNYAILMDQIFKLLQNDAFTKLYYADQYFVFSCLAFILRKDVSSLLTHDDGFMPAINVLLQYLEQWPQLTPNKPIPNTWVLSIAMLELANYISLAGTNVTSFDQLQSVLFRYLESTEDILITGALYCMYGIMQADASYVRSLVTIIYPFLKDDVPRLKGVQPDLYLKKYYAYSLALMVVLVYWSEHMQMTPTDVDLILKIVKQAVTFEVENDSQLLVMELVRNSGWQILSYLMDIQEINADIEQDVIGFLYELEPQLQLPQYPINETSMLKSFAQSTSCLRFIRKALSKDNNTPLFLESIADLLESYLVMVEQMPSLFGAMSILQITSLRTDVLQNLNDRELMFRALTLESTVLLSNIHKNGKSLLMKHLDFIFKKHARFVFQLEYDIYNVEQHNPFYKSRANGSFLGTVLHFLHLPKATAINLTSDQYIDLYRISSDTHVKLFYFELDFNVFNKLSFRQSLTTIGSPMPFMRCISAFCKFIQIALPISDAIVQRQLINTCSLFLCNLDVKSIIKRKTAFVIFASLLGGPLLLDAVAAFNAYKILLQHTTEVFTDVPHLINELLSLFGTCLDAPTSSAVVKDLLDKLISNNDVDSRHYQFMFLTSLIKNCTVIDHSEVVVNVLKSLLNDVHPLAHASGLVGCSVIANAPWFNINNKFIDLFLQLYNNLNYEEYFILNDAVGIESDSLHPHYMSCILQNIIFSLGTELLQSPYKMKLLDLACVYINKNEPYTCMNAFNIFEFSISFKMVPKLPFNAISLLGMFSQSNHSELRFVILKLLKQVSMDDISMQMLIMTTEQVINAEELKLLRILINHKLELLVSSPGTFSTTFDLLKSILNKQQQSQIVANAADDEGLQMIQKSTTATNKVIPSFNSQITAAQSFILLLNSNKNKVNQFMPRIQDLISISFNCATSSNMELKFYGLMILQDCLLTFANTKDPDVQDHSILEQYHAQFTSAQSPMFKKESPDALISSALLVISTFITSIQDVDLLVKPLLLLMTAFKAMLQQLEKNTTSNILLIAAFTSYLEVDYKLRKLKNETSINALLYQDMDALRISCKQHVIPVLTKHFFHKNSNLFKFHVLEQLQFKQRWLILLDFILDSQCEDVVFGLVISNSCLLGKESMTPLVLQLLMKMNKVEILEEDEILIDYYTHSSQLIFVVNDKMAYLTTMLYYFKKYDLNVELLVELLDKLIFHMQIEPKLYLPLMLITSGLILDKLKDKEVILCKILMGLFIGYKHFDDGESLVHLKRIIKEIKVDTLGWVIYKKIINKLSLENNQNNMKMMMGMISGDKQIIENKLYGILLYFMNGIKIGGETGIYGIQGIKIIYYTHGIENGKELVIKMVLGMLMNSSGLKGAMLEEGYGLLMLLDKRNGFMLLLNKWKGFVNDKKYYARLIQHGLPEYMGILKGFIGILNNEEKLQFQRLLAS